MEVTDYGYRYFHPELGRWISRDPIAEQGGDNLFVFVSNSDTNKFDVLGLSQARNLFNECCEKCIRIKCRPVNHWLARVFNAHHCYIQVYNCETGEEIDTINAGPNGTGGLQYSPGGDKGSGGDQHQAEIPYGQSTCDWLDCAYQLATELGDGTGLYQPTANNSNRFVREIFQGCGGSAEFPDTAVGVTHTGPKEPVPGAISPPVIITHRSHNQGLYPFWPPGMKPSDF